MIAVFMMAIAAPPEALNASAAICIMADRRRHALADIATEKKYARLGGIVNKQKLYFFQNVVQKADNGIAGMRKDIGARRTVPCSDPRMKEMRDACFEATQVDGAESDLCDEETAAWRKWISDWMTEPYSLFVNGDEQ